MQKTIDKGSELLNQFIEKTEAGGILSGEDTFKLSDTYGFPLDLTIEIAGEKGITVDTERFSQLMQEQRVKARNDRASKVGSSWSEESDDLSDIPATIFSGYETLSESSAQIMAIYVDDKRVESASEGEVAAVILDKTPFYAESGGQVGDKGDIIGGGAFAVSDTKKLASGHYLHVGKVVSDSIKTGAKCLAKVEPQNRYAIMRNHTAAHLLQAALRQVLGEHVHQAGQLVDAERCRFDFSHFSALTPEQVKMIEDIVNKRILISQDVTVKEMPIEEARQLGAMALFGEKYGNVVRVVDVKGYSTEFCGGTHVDNTAKIGLFKILSESSVASGIRRIEAVTGNGVLRLIEDYKQILNDSALAFKLNNYSELPVRCAASVQEVKTIQKNLDNLNQQIAESQVTGLFESATEIDGIKIISGLFRGTKPEVLRQMGDKIKDKVPATIAVFAGVNDESGSFCCVCGNEAIAKGAHAGKIVQRVAAITGGKGGGRPDSAMAGIGKNYMIDEALEALESIVKDFLK